jgi:hypothetical protein
MGMMAKDKEKGMGDMGGGGAETGGSASVTMEQQMMQMKEMRE